MKGNFMCVSFRIVMIKRDQPRIKRMKVMAVLMATMLEPRTKSLTASRPVAATGSAGHSARVAS